MKPFQRHRFRPPAEMDVRNVGVLALLVFQGGQQVGELLPT